MWKYLFDNLRLLHGQHYVLNFDTGEQGSNKLVNHTVFLTVRYSRGLIRRRYRVDSIRCGYFSQVSETLDTLESMRAFRVNCQKEDVVDLTERFYSKLQYHVRLQQLPTPERLNELYDGADPIVSMGKYFRLCIESLLKDMLGDFEAAQSK